MNSIYLPIIQNLYSDATLINEEPNDFTIKFYADLLNPNLKICQDVKLIRSENPLDEPYFETESNKNICPLFSFDLKKNEIVWNENHHSIEIGWRINQDWGDVTLFNISLLTRVRIDVLGLDPNFFEQKDWIPVANEVGKINFIIFHNVYAYHAAEYFFLERKKSNFEEEMGGYGPSSELSDELMILKPTDYYLNDLLKNFYGQPKQFNGNLHSQLITQVSAYFEQQKQKAFEFINSHFEKKI